MLNNHLNVKILVRYLRDVTAKKYLIEFQKDIRIITAKHEL